MSIAFEAKRNSNLLIIYRSLEEVGSKKISNFRVNKFYCYKFYSIYDKPIVTLPHACIHI